MQTRANIYELLMKLAGLAASNPMVAKIDRKEGNDDALDDFYYARRHDGDDAAHARSMLDANGSPDGIPASPHELGRGHRWKPQLPDADVLDAVSGRPLTVQLALRL